MCRPTTPQSPNGASSPCTGEPIEVCAKPHLVPQTKASLVEWEVVCASISEGLSKNGTTLFGGIFCAAANDICVKKAYRF